MMKRRLGKTELSVSIIGFGGIKLPQVDRKTAFETLNTALDLSINFFDTARAYDDSEEKIGWSIGRRRDEFFISTKSTALTAKDMEKDIRRSLKALRTDYIDIYLCHNLRHPSDYEMVMGPDGAMEGLNRARREGVVGHIGFSCHRFHETMEKGIRSGEFEALMVSYNILNDELVDEKILPLAKRMDVGVIAMKPLAGGALATPPPDLKIQAATPITTEQALKFVLANENVCVAIPSMMNPREVEENALIGETFPSMTEAEKSSLIAAAEEIGSEFCRSCGYCQPCPQGIRIPVILRHLGYYKRHGLAEWARGRYSMVEVKDDVCTECEQCAEKCPYSLDVPRMLKEAHTLLSP